MRRHLAFLCAIGVVCAIPRAAAACSCMGDIAPCSAVWQTDAVFVAQVVRIETESTRRRILLQPLETFRGPSDIVSVETGFGDADCGYGFRVGETYLIYANANKATGTYGTGICNRTRPIAQAMEDLEYLRTAARTPSTFGVLRGTVSRSDPSTEGRYTFAPFAGIRVKVDGNGVRQESTTDDRGRFEFQLPPGEYDVSTDVPEGLYDRARVRRVQLRDGRGCAEEDISLLSDGRIRGRVVDARGQPVADLPLELYTRVSYGLTRTGDHRVITRPDGTYEFTRVGPGSFFVTIDTLRPDPARRGRTQQLFLPGTVDPAAAQLVTLGPTERVRAPDFVLPEIGHVRLSGQVRSADGQALAGAEVYVRVAPPASIFFFSPPAVTDATGRFALMVPGDQDYVITVEAPNGPPLPRQERPVRPSQGERWVDIVLPAAVTRTPPK